MESNTAELTSAYLTKIVRKIVCETFDPADTTEDADEENLDDADEDGSVEGGGGGGICWLLLAAECDPDVIVCDMGFYVLGKIQY